MRCQQLHLQPALLFHLIQALGRTEVLKKYFMVIKTTLKSRHTADGTPVATINVVIEQTTQG